MSQAGAVLDPEDPVVDDIRDLLGVTRTKSAQPAGEEVSNEPAGPQPGDKLLPLLGSDDKLVPQQDPRIAVNPAISGVNNLPQHLRIAATAEAQRLPRNTIANTDPAIKRWPLYTKSGNPMYLNGDARP
jgi:hypothetical protein